MASGSSLGVGSRGVLCEGQGCELLPVSLQPGSQLGGQQQGRRLPGSLRQIWWHLIVLKRLPSYSKKDVLVCEGIDFQRLNLSFRQCLCREILE